MLLQRCTKAMYKQTFDYSAHFDPLKVNSRSSYYNSQDVVNHFIRYLRKRQIVVGSPPDERTRKKEVAPKAMLFDFGAREMHDFTTFNLSHWWKHKKDYFAKIKEKVEYDQYFALGPDVGAAKIIMRHGGRVKFTNSDEWIDKSNKRQYYTLPITYDKSYILEKIDLRGYPLRYEHLHFIFNLYNLKYLSLKGCKTIDDWALDKISIEYPMLEELDVSECENLTERGLEALYRMPSLKKLTVTNHHGSAAFDLTCFLLEDVNPNLSCHVQRPHVTQLASS